MHEVSIAEFRAHFAADREAAGHELSLLCLRATRQVRKRLRLPRTESDDLAQETCARALAGLTDERHGPLGGWVYSIALNVGRERLRDLKTKAPSSADKAALDRSLALRRTPNLRAARADLSRLADIPSDAAWLDYDDRRLIAAYHPGISERGLAAETGLPRTTLRRRVDRLIERAEEIREDSGNPGGPPS